MKLETRRDHQLYVFRIGHWYSLECSDNFWKVKGSYRADLDVFEDLVHVLEYITNNSGWYTDQDEDKARLIIVIL